MGSELAGQQVSEGRVNGAFGVGRRRDARQIDAEIQREKRKRAGFAPDCAQERAQPYCCFEPDSAGILPIRLERLHVGSLPSLGAFYDVELHGLAFLQALETA